MRFLVGLVIVVGLSLGVWQLYQYWGTFKQKPARVVAVQQEVPDDQLPGMLPSLQPELERARQRGAAGLHEFLTAYSQLVNDPRRASIELDYVLLVAPSNPAEARRVFAKLKSRLQPNSPVYNRMKLLEKTYEENP